MTAPARRAAAVLGAALLAAPLTDASAAAQLYKCVDGGRTVYQQQACSVSAQPAPAASAPRLAAKASAPAADAASAAARKLRSPSPSSGLATRR